MMELDRITLDAYIPSDNWDRTIAAVTAFRGKVPRNDLDILIGLVVIADDWLQGYGCDPAQKRGKRA